MDQVGAKTLQSRSQTAGPSRVSEDHLARESQRSSKVVELLLPRSLLLLLPYPPPTRQLASILAMFSRTSQRAVSV